MGSTGAEDLFQEMFSSFSNTEYQIMVSTGGQIEIEENTLSENLYVEQFLPGEKIMERADIVICHGGSLTVYQAIKAGTPCIVIATHLDQEWAGEELQTHKAGIFLTMIRVMAKPSLIMEATETMFDNLDEYKKNMERLQKDLLGYDGLGSAVSGITGFLESLPSS
jgi:UDP:flavonoid glycosyltransferase YjiC (YdhE family)